CGQRWSSVTSRQKGKASESAAGKSGWMNGLKNQNGMTLHGKNPQKTNPEDYTKKRTNTLRERSSHKKDSQQSQSQSAPGVERH
ncbi:hypothetical protein, partial [Pseudomonas costantinii]|uniref:hypothetical protein n=1 Tax=Pseudomonas costantinii TaxID=168469 RepID=UPI001C432E97